MARYSALFDANVLFSRELRYLIVALARINLFRGRWTEAIHREWTHHLALRYPDIAPELIAAMPSKVNDAVPDCLIEGYESLIAGLSLPDEDDKHVLAAAIQGRVDVIVTWNISDFPEGILSKHGIDAQTPDEFISNLLDLHPEEVCSVLKEARLRLKRPAATVDEYLEKLKKNELIETSKALLAHSEKL